MKRSSSSQQRFRAIGLLLSLVLVILFTAISLRNDVRSMDQKVAALYADRLQPAVDLVYLSEHIHAKRLALDDQFVAEASRLPSDLARQLKQYDLKIDNRIGQYEKTQLTTDEAIWLKAFKQNWIQSKHLEQSILRLVATGQQPAAMQLFSERGSSLFRQSIQAIHKLAQIQAETGNKAVQETHRTAAGGSINVTLLIAVSVLVSLTILDLVRTMTWQEAQSHPLHLN